jgi:endonuclease/exonuclease/phosphatase family metal-dependent hydrolase
VLPVVTISLGLQLLRVLIPSLAWYLRDTQGVSSLSLAPYAFGTFLVGLLAPAVWRVLGPRPSLRVTTGGVVLLRLAEQISHDPAIDLWLSMAGVAAFVLFLPIYLGYLRAARQSPGPGLAYGLILGISFDIALHGAIGTLDLTWHTGPAALLVTLLLGLLVVLALLEGQTSDPDAPADLGWAAVAPLLGIGPYLLLQLLIFQSSGWAEEVAGVPAPLGFWLVMLGNLLAVVGAWLGFARPATFRLAAALAAGAMLTLGAALAGQSGPIFLIILLVAQMILGWGWALLASRAAPADRPGLGKTGLALPLGMVVFLALAFAYYLALDVALPFPREAIVPAAAALLAVLYVLASRNFQPVSVPPEWPALWLGGGLLVVPLLVGWFEGPLPQPLPPADRPVRVMTFNIHSGFGSAGRHDPEAIAQVIEASGADIVALQEVSRVRLLDGGTDLAVWLARRLDLPYLFRGEEEPIWGNAVLSRYPIDAHGSGRLPDAGALIARGYLWAEIDLGRSDPLFLIATHLHHIEADHHIRLEEVPILLDLWGGRPQTVLLGDLNAKPEWEEMQLIYRAGLIDSWLEAGAGDGFTWPAVGADKRIDWIWHTSDLVAVRAEVVQTASSDHLPVLAVLAPAP